MVTKSTQVSTARASAITPATKKAHLWRILLVGLLTLFISACGGDDPIGQGQGSIGISVVGLPTGTNAAVVVTGSNFSRAVTGNDAFAVDEGSYAINASNVSASGYTFTADVAPDSVSVVAEEVSGVLVTYNAVPRVVTSGIPVINVREGERETLDLNAVIEDFENGRLNFEVITNSNPNVVATSVTSGVLAVRALRDAIDIEATVTAILTLRVTDDAGNTIEEAVRVNAIYSGDVVNPNRPPTVTRELPDIRVGVGAAPISYDLRDFFADPDGFDTLNFSIISTTVSVASATVSGNTLTVTFANAGTTNIRVTATDDEGATVSQGFQVRVVGITIPAVSGEQGDSTTIDLDDVFDGLGDNLSYEATSSNTDVATVSIDENGVLTIDFVGPGTSVITVTVRDPEGNIVSQVSFTVTVTDGSNGGGDNTAPVTRGLPDIIAEQNEPSRTFNLASFFSDAEDGGSGLSYEATSSNGAVSGVSLNGTRLTVSFGAVGNAAITVVATDSGDLSVTDVFRVTVLPPFSNTEPTANDDTATAIAGITTSINVLVNDSDPESQALTISSVSQPSTGTASNQSNRVEYTPPGTFTGQVTFNYTIRDTFGATDSAMVTVDVVANTGVPVTNNDTAATLENTPLNVAAGALLANDSDPDTGDTLTVTAVDGSGGQGTVTLTGSTVTYTPATGFTGTDTFTYTVEDTAGNSATGTVTVTVTDLTGNAPTINSFTASGNNVPVGTPVTFNYNITSADPVTCTFNPGGSGTPGAGLSGSSAPYTVTNCGSGPGSVTFTYDTAGSPTATFTAQNGSGSTDATVPLTITAGGGGNTAPVANNDTAVTDQDQAAVVDVLANDTDNDGTLAPASVAIVTQPTSGTININTTTGAITYTPSAGFTGQDTFTYTVNDDDGATSNAATVTVTVNTVGGNQGLDLTSDCVNATNVGDTCTVTVSLTGNNATFGFVGLTFDIANPSFQLNSAQATGIASGGTAGVGANQQTVAILTLAGNLIDPQENGAAAQIVFERTQLGASVFTASGGQLGANSADVGAADVVIQGSFTLNIP